MAELQHEIIQIMIPIAFGNEQSLQLAKKSSLLAFPFLLQHLILAHYANLIEYGSPLESSSVWSQSVLRALRRNEDICVVYKIHSW